MIGSGANGELTAIDILSVLSFAIGLKNLDLNVDQNDMDKQTKEIDKKANDLVNSAIAEIHAHLQVQDKKIDKIMEALSVGNNKEIIRND